MMLSLALGTLLKVTALLALAVLVDWLWRRRDPNVRHTVLATALVGALLVPLLTASLPSWRTRVPWLPNASISWTGPNESRMVESAAITPGSVAVSQRSPATPSTGESRAIRPLLIPLLAGLWIAGVLLVLSRLVRGQVEMHRLRRTARAITDIDWRHRIRTAAGDVGAKPNVDVLITPGTTVPLTCGLLRPAVLLPSDADDWSDERKRIVLVHELTHVRRHDPAMELAAWLACAVYWFHPLVWAVARRLRLQRELACDDRVVRTTGDSLSYARELVDIASTARLAPARAFAALAMAARGSLEVRVHSLLQARRPRRASTKALVRLATVGASAVALLAVMSPISAESRPTAQVPSDTLEWRITPDSPVSWSGAIRAGDTVSVRAAMGSIVVDSGPADQVSMTARRFAGPRGDSETRVSVMRSGRTTMICSVHFYNGRRVAPCEVNEDWGRGSVDDNQVTFHVHVPAGVHVVLMTGLGDLTTKSVRGDVSALTGNGDATIETDGAAVVEAYTGDIALRVLPNVRAKPLDLKVKHGSIDVALPPNGLASLATDVDTGLVFLDGVPQATKGEELLSFSGSRLRVKAQKGVVNITIPRN